MGWNTGSPNNKKASRSLGAFSRKRGGDSVDDVGNSSETEILITDGCNGLGSRGGQGAFEETKGESSRERLYQKRRGEEKKRKKKGP